MSSLAEQPVTAAADRLPEVRPQAEPGCRHPLVPVLGGAMCGIVLCQVVSMPAVVWLSGAVGGVVLWWSIWRNEHDTWRAVLAGQCALLLAVAALYATRCQQQHERFLANDLGHWATREGVPVAVRGRVISQPKIVYADLHDSDDSYGYQPGDQTRLQLEVRQLRDATTWRSVSGFARVYVRGHLLGVNAGDDVQLSAKLRSPREAMNPGQFSHAQLERDRGYLSHLSVSHPQAVVTTQPVSVANVRWWIPRLRGHLRRVLWNHLDSDRYGLAAAILLGARENLGDQRIQAFFLTGTIHLLAISGLHVGLLAAGFLYAARLQWIPQRWSWYAVITVTVLYALIAETRAPVLRATVLVVVLCVGELRREVAFSWNTLSAAALLVLAVQPMELFHTGGLLSFLAVGALIAFIPRGLGKYPEDPLQRLLLMSRPRWLRFLRGLFWRVGRVAVASFAVWCVVLPLVVQQFHIVTPIGLLLNILLVVPMGVALFSGMAVLVFAWPVPPAAIVAARVCDVSFGMLDWTVHTCESLPGGHLWWAGPPPYAVWCFYGLLAICPLVRSVRKRWALLAAGLACYLGVSFLPVGARAGSSRTPEVCATFLCVGHGLAVVVELPSHGACLYDAGALGDPRFTCDTISRFLWSRGHQRIDRLILSHADADHYNAVAGIMSRFAVGELDVAPQMLVDGDPGLGTLWESVRRYGTQVRTIQAGDQLLQGDGVVIDVLHPPADRQFSSDNANSVVLRIDFQGHAILLTGDLEEDGLEYFLESAIEPSDVVLAPHHGSLRSRPAEFAAVCRANWMVVSGENHGDTVGQNPALQDARALVLDTSRHGAITVKLDRSGVHVSTFREAE